MVEITTISPISCKLGEPCSKKLSGNYRLLKSQSRNRIFFYADFLNAMEIKIKVT